MVVWLSCRFDRPPSRGAVDRFLTDLEHVVDDVFTRLVEQAAWRGLLDLTYRIDSTDVKAMPADPDASKCYDPTAEEYYYGYGCTIVSTGQKGGVQISLKSEADAVFSALCQNPTASTAV